MKKATHREAIKEIRRRGMTVSGWSRLHRYKPDTVFKVLYGLMGSQDQVGKAILRDLKKDGLIPKQDGNHSSKPERRGVRKSS